MAVNLQTIKDIRNYLEQELADIYPKQEITSLGNIILTSALRLDRLLILRSNDYSITHEDADKVKSICTELKNDRPIQYILGETLFYDCPIKVNQSVLIPRPETEELVHLIISENRHFTGRIIDIGTGSGCIAIALAVNLKDSQIMATDFSEKALETAAENAKLNNVHISFVLSDILNPGLSESDKAEIIVSNPPYVRQTEKKQMYRNVLDYEPHSALFVPDEDPLVFYRAILTYAGKVLSHSGKIYFEINETMGAPLSSLMETYKYSDVNIIKDINGKDRFLKGKKDA